MIFGLHALQGFMRIPTDRIKDLIGLNGRYVLMPLRASCSFQLTMFKPEVYRVKDRLNAPQGFMLIPTNKPQARLLPE